MTEFRLTLLGGFGLSAGAPCATLSNRAQALLAFLAIPAGQTHRRDKLASLLWSDQSEKSARQNLRQCLTGIRRACQTGEALPVLAGSNSLRLDTTRVTVDVAEFEEALNGPDPAALGRALALYRGELLEGLSLRDGPFEAWLMGERRRLSTMATKALGQLLQHQEGTGAHEEAMQTAQRLLTIDPLQEAVHRTLMRLYHETGNTALALRQFAICEKLLRRELNVEPEAETKELQRDILRSRRASHQPSSKAGARQEVSVGNPLPSGGQDIDSTLERGLSLPTVAEILRGVDTPAVPTDRPSVAVLPFLTNGDEPRHAALADAICEDVTVSLSGISRLMVIANSSTFAYRGKEIDVRRIGHDLGVAHIARGRVRPLGSRVRISAQLVNTFDSSIVWADHYDQDVGATSAVQDQIAQEIVTALEVKLVEGEQIRSWRRDAVSPEAYQFLASAREAYMTFSRGGMARARQNLQQSIRINPGFAAAHAFLGFTLRKMPDLGGLATAAKPCQGPGTPRTPH